MKILIPRTEKELEDKRKDLVVLEAPEEYKENMRAKVLHAKSLLEECEIELKQKTVFMLLVQQFIKENEHWL